MLILPDRVKSGISCSEECILQQGNKIHTGTPEQKMESIRQPRVLLVEDDLDLSKLVARRLTESSMTVQTVHNGLHAVRIAEEQPPDLVILDIMLPGIDGLEVCRQLRAKYPLLYILMLTARADEIDRVVGLEVGADDYVTKPFSLQELVARVRSALRRVRLEAEKPESDDDEVSRILRFDALEIDTVRREVKHSDEKITLTVREYDLLLFLARHPDRPFTRGQLLDKVWDIQYEGYDRTVDSHIQRLRSKVESDPANPRFIRTVWGVGYKFQSEGED